MFRRFFLAGSGPASELLTINPKITAETAAVLQLPATEPDAAGRQEEAALGLMASDAETLRHKSFAACTPAELAALRRIMARLALTPPKRRTRRW